MRHLLALALLAALLAAACAVCRPVVDTRCATNRRGHVVAEVCGEDGRWYPIADCTRAGQQSGVPVACCATPLEGTDGGISHACLPEAECR